MPARKPPRKILVLIERFKRLKELVKEGTDQLKGDDGVEAQLISEMDAMGVSNVTVQLDEGPKVSVSIVRAVIEELDEDALHACLNDDQWAAITKPRVDKGLLEDAMASGVVPATVVATCSNPKPKKPYVALKEVRKTGKPTTELVRAGRAKSEAAKKIGRSKT